MVPKFLLPMPLSPTPDTRSSVYIQKKKNVPPYHLSLKIGSVQQIRKKYHTFRQNKFTNCN